MCGSSLPGETYCRMWENVVVVAVVVFNLWSVKKYTFNCIVISSKYWNVVLFFFFLVCKFFLQFLTWWKVSQVSSLVRIYYYWTHCPSSVDESNNCSDEAMSFETLFPLLRTFTMAGFVKSFIRMINCTTFLLLIEKKKTIIDSLLSYLEDINVCNYIFLSQNDYCVRLF